MPSLRLIATATITSLGLVARTSARAGADMPLPSLTPVVVTNCRAIDGDTLRCGSIRIRLLGIDAAELPGHCRIGRHCAPGDPFAQQAALRRLAAQNAQLQSQLAYAAVAGANREREAADRAAG